MDEEINSIIDGLIELGCDLKNKEKIRSFILFIISKQTLDISTNETDITF